MEFVLCRGYGGGADSAARPAGRALSGAACAMRAPAPLAAVAPHHSPVCAASRPRWGGPQKLTADAAGAVRDVAQAGEILGRIFARRRRRIQGSATALAVGLRIVRVPAGDKRAAVVVETSVSVSLAWRCPAAAGGGPCSGGGSRQPAGREPCCLVAQVWSMGTAGARAALALQGCRRTGCGQQCLCCPAPATPAPAAPLTGP